MYFIFEALSNSIPLLVPIVKLPDSIPSVFCCSSNKKSKVYYDSQQFQQNDNHISRKIIEFKIVTKYGIGNPCNGLVQSQRCGMVKSINGVLTATWQLVPQMVKKKDKKKTKNKKTLQVRFTSTQENHTLSQKSIHRLSRFIHHLSLGLVHSIFFSFQFQCSWIMAFIRVISSLRELFMIEAW